MKRKDIKFSFTLLGLLIGLWANAAFADLSASLKINNGYTYWSARFYQENVSPAICSQDSIQALEAWLYSKDINYSQLDFGLTQQCEQLTFMGGMLPKMARDMNPEARDFFKDNYGLAFFLSGLNPEVEGYHHRKGWWQLTYPVAVKYGLQVNAQVDERLDPTKSSEVASKYFNDLLQKFRSRDLAIIAFVYGPIEAEKVLQSNPDMITLNYKHRRTIEEVNAYFNLFNWVLQRMPYSITKEKENTLKKVSFDGKVVVSLLLDETKMSQEDFLKYNPSVIGSIIPLGYEDVMLFGKIKKGAEEELVMSSVLWLDSVDLQLAATRDRIKKNLPDPNSMKVTSHKVRSGESLGLISNKYGVKIKDLKSWNNLRSDVIYAGQKLVVYVPKSKVIKKEPTAIKETKPKKDFVPLENGSYLVHEVVPGETLWSIAQNYPGVSAQNIMTWNGISDNIQVGQQIQIKKSEIRSK